MLFIIFSSENTCVIKLSNSELKKAGKIIKIPYFLSNKFAKF